MPRLRLYDVRTSRLFEALGICQGDVSGMGDAVNAAQERLILAKEAGDQGWFGSWVRTAFNVDRTNPYITLPRELARLGSVSVCKRPVVIQNEFYEYLEFGIGPQDESPTRRNRDCTVAMYDRGSVPTMVDLNTATGPQILRLRMEDSNDVDNRVLLQGLDNNGNKIRSQDGYNMVDGIFVSLQVPFVDCPIRFTKITGIQKDNTIGRVSIYQADPATGNEVLLLTMSGPELVSGYRRYYLNNTPWSCCPVATGTPAVPVQVSGWAKLEILPVVSDTDYLIIQSLEALIAECQAVRYSEMDTLTSDQKLASKHRDAIRLLQGQLVHYLGKEKPAVQIKPFGSARLERRHVGMI
jgi:hypothetical protein